MPGMDLKEYLQRVANPDHPLSKHGLTILSDLDTERAAIFASAWRYILCERRRDIVAALVELAEDNIELDFRQVLLVCLDDPDAEVRAMAVGGLWEDDRLPTMRRVLGLAHDTSGAVRAAAMLFLGRAAYRVEMGELPEEDAHAVCATLLEVVADPEQPLDVRRRAVEGLGYLSNSAEAQATIGRAYAHAEQLMRESALVAMGRSMHPTWFPYIQRELHSPSPALRYEAARAVGELGEEGRELQGGLLPLIDDDDSEVAQAAIWALGQTGGPQARRVLQRLVRSKDAVRSQAAEEALQEIMLDEM